MSVYLDSSLSIKQRFSYIYSVSLSFLLMVLYCLLFSSSVWAQACNNELDGTTLSWTQPSQIDPADEQSLRWPVDASLRFTFSGSWCPSRDEITLIDEDGVEIPADITFEAPDQLVPGGPMAINMGLVNPLMSLQARHDYTLTISPPDPALILYENYEVVFRTANTEMGDFSGFNGLDEVGLAGDFCDGGVFLSGTVDNFECVTPSTLLLELSFMPLEQSEATYVVYRTKSVPDMEESGGRGEDPPSSNLLEYVDEVERRIAFIPGVHPDFADQPVKVVVSVQYSPLPRTDCFKVVVLDEWGRPRGGSDVEQCIELKVPAPCPAGCEESGMCQNIFPPSNTSEILPPLPGARCAPIGIHGASGRTPIPPLMEERVQAQGMNDTVEEEEMENGSATEDEGCQIAVHSSQGMVNGLGILVLLCLIMVRRHTLSTQS